jgi:hypothetical protein
MKKHFTTNHPEYKEDTTARPITTFFPTGKETTKAAYARKELISWLGTSSTALRTLDNIHLKRMLASIDGFLPPGRTAVAKEIKQLGSNITEKIVKLVLESTQRYAISADIATAPGMRASFIGIMIHFWNGTSFSTAALDVVGLYTKHCAANIKEVIGSSLLKNGLNPAKVHAFVTDAASNMVAALKGGYILADAGLDPVNEDELDNAGNLLDLDEMWAELEENAPIDSTHFTCKSHRLQLVLKVLDKPQSAALRLRRKVFAVINHFRHSHTASRELLEATGLNVLMFAATRWSYTSIVYKRLLEIAAEFNRIALAHGWETISASELTEIGEILEVIEPFHSFTNALQQDRVPTISLLYPGIQQLQQLLQEIGTRNKYAGDLRDELNGRFHNVLESGDDSSNLY